jgi:hypothetical protein
MPIEARQIEVDGTTVDVVGVPENCFGCPKMRAVFNQEVKCWRNYLAEGQGVLVTLNCGTGELEASRRFKVTSEAVIGQFGRPRVRAYSNYRMVEACPEGCGGRQMPVGEYRLDFHPGLGGTNWIVRTGN